MFIINIMWLIPPVSLFIILFILLISKSLIKGKKVFFSFFCLILIYIILGLVCYYFYELFLKNEYTSFLIALICIGIAGLINLIVVYSGIEKLKRKNNMEELLRLQHDIEKNLYIEDRWFNMLFSYSSDRWTVSDINADLLSKLDETNLEEDTTEIIEMNKEIKIINENYKFLKRNLRRKYFFLKNINSITNIENNENKKSVGRKKTSSNIKFDLSKESEKIVETIKSLSNELVNLLRLEENDKTKIIEGNLARSINYMSNILYNQLKIEAKFKEAKLNEFSSYIQAEKVLLDNMEELRENMYNYTYKIKRKLREIKEKME